jgi:hypothetical protein
MGTRKKHWWLVAGVTVLLVIEFGLVGADLLSN